MYFLMPSVIFRISNDFIILASCLIWVDEFLDKNLKKAKDIEMAVVEAWREKKVFALKIKWWEDKRQKLKSWLSMTFYEDKKA